MFKSKKREILFIIIKCISSIILLKYLKILFFYSLDDKE